MALLNTVNTFSLDAIHIEVWTSEESATSHPLIKEFNFQHAPDSISEVFSSGELTSNVKNELIEMDVPIIGEQGIYGVLQVQGITLDKQEEMKELFQILGEEAGKAIEKIKLYIQSKRRIKDLQMLNDFTLKLNTSLRFTESLTLLKNHFQSVFHMQEVGFFFKNKDHQIETSKESTSFFGTKRSKIYTDYAHQHFKYKTNSVFMGKASVKIDVEEEMPYQTVLMFPFLDDGEIIGYTLLLHQESYAFDWDVFKNMESIIFHSSLAITNAILKEELERLAMTDPLTHLYSRRYLNKKIEKSMRDDSEGTFIILDIDNFKEINDLYGHQVGDNVLVQLGQHVLQNIRKHDVGARWGGEELAVYLPKTPLQAGIMVADRLVKTVSEVTNPSITVSCGVSYWKNNDKSSSYRSLFEWADRALYKAKSLGKNKIIVYNHKES
ncbi:hypothetical protein GCM10008967_24580 [Bacillus carboniphilus]|uniref:GGDEF domain-containing protein n=1 Tax=Bacillus carboniphilus TaxID=86663 RepID=A0ABN0WDF4_9BACI